VGPTGVLASYGVNLATIFSRIRFEAGYTGPIVAVAIYARDYHDATEVGPITALNGVLATVAPVFGVTIADAFTAFAIASGPSGDACAAGLLIALPTGGCDIHPSAAGQQLIAQTVLAQLPTKK